MWYFTIWSLFFFLKIPCFSYTYSVLYLLRSRSYRPTSEFSSFFLMLTVLLYLCVVFGKESSLFLEALLVLFTLVL